MDTLLCNDDGDIVIGTYDPSNTLLRLSADQYTAGSATWADQSGNALDFTVSTNTSLKGTDADGFPYMNFNGTYGSATRGSNIPAPTSGTYTVFCITQIKASTAIWRSLMFGSGDIQLIIQNGSNNLGLYNGGFVDSGFNVTTAMTSSRNLLVVELSQTAPIFKFQLNESGTDSTINSSTGFAIPFNTIGTNGGNYWGNIYEFIVYDGFLSASERDYVAEYLAYKWDISSKLPSLTSTHGVMTLLPNTGRYVRLQQTVNDRIINLREIEVYDENNVNVALNKPVTGDTPAHGSFPYSNLTDGITNTNTNVGHTTGYQITGDNYDYVQIDLGSITTVSRIFIYNRTDSTTVRNRAIGIKAILIAANGTTIVKETPTITTSSATYTLTF
jgi:hypothetical protein